MDYGTAQLTYACQLVWQMCPTVFSECYCKRQCVFIFGWPKIAAGEAAISFWDGEPTDPATQHLAYATNTSSGRFVGDFFGPAEQCKYFIEILGFVFPLVLSDRGPSWTVTSFDDLGSRYVYIGNLTLLHVDLRIDKNATDDVQNHFTREGLHIHELDPTLMGGDALSIHIDGKALAARKTLARFAKLRNAVRGILRRKRVAGWQLEVLIGHCTYLVLIQREIICIFHSVYPYISKHFFAPRPIWDAVRDELRAFAGVMC